MASLTFVSPGTKTGSGSCVLGARVFSVFTYKVKSSFPGGVAECTVEKKFANYRTVRLRVYASSLHAVLFHLTLA